MMAKILSIDGRGNRRLELSRLFSRFDCEWLEAAGAEEGLAVARREQPHLIILEGDLPGTDRIAVLRTMREDPGLKRTPVIVLTAGSGPERLADLARLRVRDYVAEPFRGEELLAKAGRIIPLGPRRREPEAEVRSASQPTPAGDLPGAPAPLERAAVLVVDDSPTMRMVLVGALNALGVQDITEAANGRAALDLARSRSFDLLLLDMEMPEMDGMEVLSALKADPGLCGLPVLVVSGDDQLERAVRCIESGAEDYLTKPFHPTLLRARVTTALEKKRLRELERHRLAQPPAEKPRAEEAAGIESTAAGAPEADHPAAGPADLPAIEGLASKEGLARVGGNRKLYLKILRQFVEGQGPVVGGITAALIGGDRSLAERLAHTLKGVAGSIGARAVQAAAGNLEKLIRDRADQVATEAAKLQVAAVLDPLVAGLEAALDTLAPEAAPSISPPVTVDRTRTREAASRLAALLSEFDAGAADLVEKDGPALRPLFTGEGWPQFEMLVQSYEFPEALARLTKALDEFR